MDVQPLPKLSRVSVTEKNKRTHPKHPGKYAGPSSIPHVHETPDAFYLEKSQEQRKSKFKIQTRKLCRNSDQETLHSATELEQTTTSFSIQNPEHTSVMDSIVMLPDDKSEDISSIYPGIGSSAGDTSAAGAYHRLYIDISVFAVPGSSYQQHSNSPQMDRANDYCISGEDLSQYLEAEQLNAKPMDRYLNGVEDRLLL